MIPPAAAELAESGRCFLRSGSRCVAVSAGDLFRKEQASISARTGQKSEYDQGRKGSEDAPLSLSIAHPSKSSRLISTVGGTS